MAQILGGAGYQGTNEPDQAQVLIVNTCGFIGPAKEESLTALRDLAKNKREDQYLIAAGCLSQRYGARGMGPSMYLRDPDGNVVELKGT